MRALKASINQCLETKRYKRETFGAGKVFALLSFFLSLGETHRQVFVLLRLYQKTHIHDERAHIPAAEFHPARVSVYTRAMALPEG